ncbi:MAG: DNA polymerase I [Candidatus Omnitrophica bacterium]|nr:DNA polymerase I [Candidatus Omnitrophota bacterium]
MPRLCLIDTHSLCYRAFFATIKANMMTSYGQPTNAVYGFVRMLNKILDDIKPEYVVMCFDVDKPTFREKKFKEYKIQRKPMPDDLKTQIPLIREIISAYNLKIIEKEGYEADDVIAALTCRAKKQGFKVIIVTSDKDMLQLVDSDIKVYNPYKGEGVYFSPREVEEQFGVRPKNIIDLLSLTGDSVDNIPGAKGIGEKTARELLEEFHSVDRLLENIDKIKSDKIRDLIRENKKEINLSQELIKLPTDFEVDFDLKDLSSRDADYEKLYKIFSRLEFKSLLKNIGDRVTKKNTGKRLDFIKNIKESTDFKQLEKELKKTNAFSFSFNIEQNEFKVSIYAGGDNLYVLSNRDKLSLIFKDRKLNKIGSDIKRAKLIFDKYGINIGEDFFDIMIAAYLLTSARTDYQITTLLYDYLKIGPLSNEDLVKNEAIFIYKLKEVLEKEFEDKGLKDLFYQLEMPLVDVLFRIEKNGVKIDCGLLNELSDNLNSQLNKLMQEIFKLSKRTFNINSPKQLREILFAELKLPIVKRTKTGPSTDEEVLRKLSTHHKMPSLILAYRQITKLKSTYVDVLPNLCDKKTNRIHSNFLQTGTETGRLSSNNPNLQNIPIKTEIGREVRGAFISSSAKWSLLSCDYSQIELRILAHLSKDEVLIAAFRKDCDVHKTTAALIYQVDIGDVQDQMREIAKRVNFGVIYGMSAYGLSKDLDISTQEAQDFIDTYFLRYPKVNEFINKQIEFAKDKGYVSTIMGRRRYLPYINSKNNNLRQFSERQAVNAVIQGSAADLIKLAMIDIQHELDKKNMQTKMVIQVHDELVFDFPKQEQFQLINIVKKGMEEAIKLDVPIKASLKIGQNWARMESIE